MKYLYCFLFLPLLLLSKTVDRMTIEEKVGLLFMVPAHPDHLESLFELLENYPIKAVISKATDCASHRQMIEKLEQWDSFFIGMDAEWGLGMRFKDGLSFPKNLTLGAIQDDGLLYDLGYVIGVQCKEMRAHINFAPVIDVNSNPQNPIIHMRSFGSDPVRVTKKARALARGMQDAGLLACVKHFPGHGDTDQDSHYTLPVIKHTLKEHAIDLFPFASLFDSQVDAVMTSHLSLPAYDADMPTSLSKKVIFDLIRNQYAFSGLIISDALNMKALSENYSPEMIARLAYEAGHDILLYAARAAPNIERILKKDVPKAFDYLVSLFKEKKVSLADLDERVERIMKARKGRTASLEKKIDPLELKKTLFKEAITLVQNDKEYFPLKHTDFAIINMHKDAFVLEGDPSQDIYLLLIKEVDLKDPYYGLDLEKIKEWDQEKKLVIFLFQSPYVLRILKNLEASIVVFYENDPVMDEMVEDVARGNMPVRGVLPISIE